MNSNSHESDSEIAAYWAAAATASGKFRIVLRIRVKWLIWTAVGRGATALRRIVDLIVSSLALICLSPIFRDVSLFSHAISHERQKVHFFARPI